MTRTWLVKDLEALATSGSKASIASAMLDRIRREAAEKFDASDGLRLDKREYVGSGLEVVEATLIFATVNLKGGGQPSARLRVEAPHSSEYVSVSVGKKQVAEFLLTAETPPSVFLALFAAAVTSMEGTT